MGNNLYICKTRNFFGTHMLSFFMIHYVHLHHLPIELEYLIRLRKDTRIAPFLFSSTVLSLLSPFSSLPLSISPLIHVKLTFLFINLSSGQLLRGKPIGENERHCPGERSPYTVPCPLERAPSSPELQEVTRGNSFSLSLQR